MRFGCRLVDPMRVVRTIKIAEREEIRSSLVQAILLCTQRQTKAFESENILCALHIVTPRYLLNRENCAPLVATVTPRVLPTAFSAIAVCLATPTAEYRKRPEIKAIHSFVSIEALIADIADDRRG